MKEYKYKGYTVRKSWTGWFAAPEKEDPKKDRWGYSIPMDSKCAVEAWIDEQRGR